MKQNMLILIGLIMISLIICLDLLLGPGEPATFDGPIHITNIAQFYQALKAGDFPVTWANNFANYGSPIPIVAQQLPAYAGALLMFMTKDPVISYKILIVTGYTMASILLYFFLRRFFEPLSAFSGAVFFAFSEYRIINLYIRGAGPELLSLVWIPLILIGIDMLFKKESYANAIITFGMVGLLLTHPLIFVISQFIFIPFIIWSWSQTRHLQAIQFLIINYVLSLMVGAFYLFPLFLEMKYFPMSRKITQLINHQFIPPTHYFDSGWSYYGDGDIFVRKNAIRFGVPETLILLSGVALLFLYRKKTKERSILWWSLATSTILIFFTLEPSGVLYENIPFLDSVQFPWRMLTILSILPPIIASLWLETTDKNWLKAVIIFTILFPIALDRIPQVYGKNYTKYPIEHYLSTTKNLYFDEMNTLWSGSTHTYPKRTSQAEIISGEGSITSTNVSNSHRTYTIKAVTPLRLVDYTFYFPGWHVYVDGNDTVIEFQDEKFRGVITYNVPAGDHQVKVVFEPTKIRRLGYLTTLGGLAGMVVYAALNAKKKKATKQHSHTK